MLIFFVFSILLPHIIFCDKVVICETKSQTIYCPTNQVIRISSAEWGRTLASICVNGQYSDNTNCHPITATNAVTQRCEGQQTCYLTANNTFVGHDPCSGTYKYLDIEYTCELNVDNVKVCEGGRLAIDCPENKLIRVLSTVYGRHSTTPCHYSAEQSVYCGLDETNMVKSVCDGLQSCNMEASLKIFKIDPCVGTWKYTDVDYVCEPKIPGEQRQTACDGQTFSITCHSPAKIQVIQATYGRTGKTICPSPGADGNTQCVSDRTSDISQRCNGLETCSFSVVLPRDPCVGIYKYINVRYLCKQ